MVITKLKENMIVYDVKRASGMSAFNSKWTVWTVLIKAIDLDSHKVLASWNCNPSKWYDERTWKKWRINKPE